MEKKDNTNTVNGQDDFITKFVEKAKKKDKIIKEVLTEDYIKWLLKYTYDREWIEDKTCDYEKEHLDINKKNLSRLCILFEIVEDYAQKNYISPLSVSPFSDSYRIKYNGVGFKIGVMTGQGTYFYCNRIEIENANEYIDFIDIINNVKQENVDFITKSLKELEDEIKKTYKKGIPIREIEKTTNETIKKLKKKKN